MLKTIPSNAPTQLYSYVAYFELGVIMEATEHPELGFKAYEKALDDTPQMQKLQKRIEALLDEKSPQAL